MQKELDVHVENRGTIAVAPPGRGAGAIGFWGRVGWGWRGRWQVGGAGECLYEVGMLILPTHLTLILHPSVYHLVTYVGFGPLTCHECSIFGVLQPRPDAWPACAEAVV